MAGKFLNQSQPQVPTVDAEGDYSWDQAKQDPELLTSVKRYARNVENKVFKDDNEAFDWFVNDRRWKDANTVSALKELNYVKGGWGTKFASKEDLQDLHTIRSKWERLPGGFSRIADGDISGGLEAIGSNIVKGLVDPTIAVGGVAGKVAGSLVGQGVKKATQIGVGMAADAAVTGGVNAAYQEANVEIGKKNPELGLPTEVDPWEALTAGGLGAIISAPGHVLNANHTAKKADIGLAAKQAEAAAARLRGNGITDLFSPKARDNMAAGDIGKEIDAVNGKAAEDNIQFPTGEANVTNLNQATEAKLKDRNSLVSTLSSQFGVPLPEVEAKAKKIYDYISGKMLNINSTVDTKELLSNVEGFVSSDLNIKDKNQGKQTWAATEAAAQRGLQGKDLETTVKAITNKPAGYAPSAVEHRTIDIVKGALWDKWDAADAALEKDPTNKALARESQRLEEMYTDLASQASAFTSETARALRIKAYTQNTPEGIFRKAGEAVSKVTNAVTGNTSKFSIDVEQRLELRAAIKKLTGPDGTTDPLKVDLFLTNLDNQKLGVKDALWEAWYNSLLSSPSTNVINTIGNATVTGIQMAENAIGDTLSGRNPKYLLAGYFKSIPEAFKVFTRTFSTEIPNDPATRMELKESHAIPSYIWDTNETGLNRFRKAGVGEGGWGGRQVRLPGRFLMAADDAAKVGHYRAFITDAALREIEAQEAKLGVKFSEAERLGKLDELVSSPTPEMDRYGKEMARTLTFTSPLGGLGTGIQHIVEDLPGGRLVVPFVRTPGNILKYAADMVSVPGVLSTKRTAEDFAAGGVRANRAKARLMMGYGIMSAGVWAGLSGNATGAGPSDPNEKDSWMANNLPWSIKAGNTWIQWNRLDPVALPFAIGVGATDVAKSLNDPQREGAFYETVAKLFADAVLDKTWFQGVQNVMNAVTDPEKSGESFLQGITRTFVPSIVAGSARAYDPRVTAPQTFMEVLQDRIGFDARDKVPSKLDVYGREVPVEVLGAGAGSSGILAGVARLSSPFKTKEVDADPVAAEVANLRMQIKAPSKTWNGVQLDSNQYYVYSKAKGQYLYNGLKYVMEDPSWKNMPDGAKRIVVDVLKAEAAKVADVALYGVYPDILGLRYDPDNNKTIKKFLTPSQKQLDEKVLSPNRNPIFEEKGVKELHSATGISDIELQAAKGVQNPGNWSEPYAENKGLYQFVQSKLAEQQSGKTKDALAKFGAKAVQRGDVGATPGYDGLPGNIKLPEIVNAVSQTTSNPAYKEVADALVDALPNVNVHLQGGKWNATGATGIDAKTGEVKYVKILGMPYNTSGLSGTFDKSSSGLNDETVLHEGIHAAVHNALANKDADVENNEFYKNMKVTYDNFNTYVRNNPRDFDKYSKALWFTEPRGDFQEFIAYAFTNPRFQNVLKQTEGFKQGTSYWTMLTSNVANFLGIDYNQESRTNALDYIMSQKHQFFDALKKK